MSVRAWLVAVTTLAFSTHLVVASSAQPSADAGVRHVQVQLPSPVTVPMPLHEHFPTVEVRLNGQGPFTFNIDTGFGGAAEVTADVARSLGLERVGEVETGDPSGIDSRTLPVHALRTLEIAGATFSGLRVAAGSRPVLEAAGLAGTIGFRLFDGLLVTFDYPNQQLRIERGSLKGVEGAVPYDDSRGIPAVEVNVAGVVVSADVDAGAPSLLTLPIALAARVPLAAQPRVVGKGRTVSNELTISAAPLDGDVTLGTITIARPELTFVDVLPHAHFGSRFLRQYAVTFDTSNHLVRFAR